MTKTGDETSGRKRTTGDRAERLAEALRANLRRRKEAARSVADKGVDEDARRGSPSERDR